MAVVARSLFRMLGAVEDKSPNTVRGLGTYRGGGLGGVSKLRLVKESKKSCCAVQSKKAVSANIKLIRYFHLPSDFWPILSHGKRLYDHMFDMVDTAFYN